MVKLRRHATCTLLLFIYVYQSGALAYQEATIIDCKDVVCPQEECKGVLLPMGSADGCCDYCLQFLEENELCNRLLTTVPITGRPVCGPNLICRKTEQDPTPKCRRRASKCVKFQDQVDLQLSSGDFNSSLHKPRCDSVGLFSGFQCAHSSMCYCVNEENKRIFGETSVTEIPSYECACTRYRTNNDWEAIKHPFKLRCTLDGGFYPVQCFEDKCFCVDRSGSTKFKQKVSRSKIMELPCYNINTFTDLSKTCLGKFIQLSKKAKKEKLVGYDLPSCGLDWNYEAVQYENDRAFCVDKMNKRLGNYEVSRASVLGFNMKCHCARNRHLELSPGTMPPKCCPNGNYYPWQCAGRMCYCVDQDGIQTGDDVYFTLVNTLDCYSDTPCYEAKGDVE